jgi:hypothetical protein
MRRFGIVAAVLLFACVGCASDPMKAPWRVLPNVDFNYNATWDAAMLSVQQHFPHLFECNKDDMKISSYYKMDPDIITSPYEYAKRAFLNIHPRESTERRTVYEIAVHVGKYWRPRSPIKESDEGWILIRWVPELEQAILDSFEDALGPDRRVRKGGKKFEKRRSVGWP